MPNMVAIEDFFDVKKPSPNSFQVVIRMKDLGSVRAEIGEAINGSGIGHRVVNVSGEIRVGFKNGLDQAVFWILHFAPEKFPGRFVVDGQVGESTRAQDPVEFGEPAGFKRIDMCEHRESGNDIDRAIGDGQCWYAMVGNRPNGLWHIFIEPANVPGVDVASPDDRSPSLCRKMSKDSSGSATKIKIAANVESSLAGDGHNLQMVTESAEPIVSVHPGRVAFPVGGTGNRQIVKSGELERRVDAH